MINDLAKVQKDSNENSSLIFIGGASKSVIQALLKTHK